MKKWSLLVAAAALSGLVLAGCSGSGGNDANAVIVNESMESLTFGQKELTVQKGQPVKLVVANKDGQLHDLSIDKIPAKVKEEHSDMHDMGGKMPDLHVSVDAGKTGEVTFTPTEAGTYTFYCTVPGHKDAGMQGKLVVKG
jgi:uncharacterized cupredoxin-like copper-binding protein